MIPSLLHQRKKYNPQVQRPPNVMCCNSPQGLMIHWESYLIIQELWQKKLEWDEPLAAELETKWNEIAQDIQDSSKASLTLLHICSKLTNGPIAAASGTLYADVRAYCSHIKNVKRTCSYCPLFRD